MKTGIQRGFAPFKTLLPLPVWTRLRKVATAVSTPVLFTYWSGHFRSSLAEKALSRKGEPLPWYTYPCIDLLRFQDFNGKKVLEFGGGQSTLWWAARADKVVTIETDSAWHAHLVKIMPANVDLHFVSGEESGAFLAAVKTVLEACVADSFDIIVIDAEYRGELVALSLEKLAHGGAIICDDAESYPFYENSHHLDIQRVDFFGYSPGVVLPHCTSVMFRNACFLFKADRRIPDVGVERD